MTMEKWNTGWIRVDAAFISAATLAAVGVLHGSWMWFFALFLVPDLSMAGYAFGPRVGAVTYNLGHLFAWPAGMLVAGLMYHTPFMTTAALSWIAHIAFDHAVGYGLKLPTGFEYTTLGPIGRARATAQGARR
jgi:hypothetical protein